MGGISNASLAVLKKTSGASNIGTDSGNTVQEWLYSFSASFTSVDEQIAGLMPKAGGSFTGDVGFGSIAIFSNDARIFWVTNINQSAEILRVSTLNEVIFNNSGLTSDLYISVTDGYTARFRVGGAVQFNYNINGVQFGSGARVTAFSADGTLAENADYYVPTQKAVKTYVDNSVSAIPAGYASLITSAEISSAVSVIDILLTGAYDEYIIELINLIPSTDDTDTFLRLLTSSDGGTNFDTGASDYAYAVSHLSSSTNSSAASAIPLIYEPAGYGIGAAANERGYSGTIKIFDPMATQYTHMKFDGVYRFSQTQDYLMQPIGNGVRLSAGVVNAVRLVLSKYDFASGKVAVYGVNR